MTRLRSKEKVHVHELVKWQIGEVNLDQKRRIQDKYFELYLEDDMKRTFGIFEQECDVSKQLRKVSLEVQVKQIMGTHQKPEWEERGLGEQHQEQKENIMIIEFPIPVFKKELFY